MLETRVVSERIPIISSDGHAIARMPDYRPYLDSEWREAFDAFCKVYAEFGSRPFEPVSLRTRCDEETVELWQERVEPDRLDGSWDPAKRVAEVEREGIVGEVIFPDFGMPFEMNSPLREAVLNNPPRTQEQLDAGNRAWVRWLVDYCSVAPERFAGMAPVSFAAFVDVEAAIEQIRWAHSVGMKGIVPPYFDAEYPLYHPKFDPIWATISDLGLVVNAHAAVSGVRTPDKFKAPLPHPAVGFTIFGSQRSARDLLSHFIWGGVFERHPNLKLVLTEMTSGWVISELAQMDYSYDGSYLSHDIRGVMPMRPSEYYHRNVYMGSSVFSAAEVGARDKIGVEKMMLGVDYPHHEGAWNGGTKDYFQATLGAKEVPVDEARLMLGKTAADAFGFDYDKLAKIAADVGPIPQEILTPPTEDKFPRGDVHKPL